MKSGPLFLAAGVALLGGLFIAFKPKAGADPMPPPPAPSDLSLTPAAPMTRLPKVFELTVKQGKLASGPATLAAREGDDIVIRVTSDRADELHLHGYDLEMMLKANEPAELSFKALRSGRFEYELHKSHTDLGALEVQPKP